MPRGALEIVRRGFDGGDGGEVVDERRRRLEIFVFVGWGVGVKKGLRNRVWDEDRTVAF